MCGAFSSGRGSLVPAATSAWAKPNHGFFNCQHPDTIILQRRSGVRPGICIEGKRGTRAKSGGDGGGGCSRTQETAFFQCFCRSTWMKVRVAVQAGTMHAPCRQRSGWRRRRRFGNSQAGCSLSRRTTPFARKCANLRARSRRLAQRMPPMRRCPNGPRACREHRSSRRSERAAAGTDRRHRRHGRKRAVREQVRVHVGRRATSR